MDNTRMVSELWYWYDMIEHIYRENGRKCVCAECVHLMSFYMYACIYIYYTAGWHYCNKCIMCTHAWLQTVLSPISNQHVLTLWWSKSSQNFRSWTWSSGDQRKSSTAASVPRQAYDVYAGWQKLRANLSQRWINAMPFWNISHQRQSWYLLWACVFEKHCSKDPGLVKYTPVWVSTFTKTCLTA